MADRLLTEAGGGVLLEDGAGLLLESAGPLAGPLAGGVARRTPVSRAGLRTRTPGRVARRGLAGRVARGNFMGLLQTTLPKAAAEVVGYVFDFSGMPEFAAGDTLASAAVPAVSGLTIGTPAVLAALTDGVAAGKGIQVTINGGTAGTRYVVTCLGTFASGAVRAVKLALEVE